MARGRFVEFDLGDLDRLVDLLEAAPEIAGEEIYAALTASTALLERDVKELTPTAAGTLRNSVFGEVRVDTAGGLGVVASPLEHAEYVELGTKPHFPPLEPLEDWVRTKGLAQDDADVKRIAFLVARKIAQRGTLAVGMFNRAFAANEANVERIFALHTQRIVDRMASEGAR
jgi:hypothetical protein